MIKFTTLNSEYSVEILDGKFHVTKTQALNPESTYMAVGQTHIAKRMRLEVGDRANFDGLSTSPVVRIADLYERKTPC